jgi:hypothetical protein
MHTLSSIFQRLLEDSAISNDIKRMGNKRKKEISRKKANSMSKKPQMLLKLAYEYRSFLTLKVVHKKKKKNQNFMQLFLRSLNMMNSNININSDRLLTIHYQV